MDLGDETGKQAVWLTPDSARLGITGSLQSSSPKLHKQCQGAIGALRLTLADKLLLQSSVRTKPGPHPDFGGEVSYLALGAGDREAEV